MAKKRSAKELIELVSTSWTGRHRAESQSTDWGQTLAMYGLLSTLRNHDNPTVRKYLETWLRFHMNERLYVNYFCGSWSFGLLYPNVYNEFPEIQLQLRESAERIYSFIDRKALRNGEGIILHNVDLPNIYIDTVYYSGPILQKLGTFLGLPWQEEAVGQIMLHLDRLQDGNKPFYIHCEENVGGRRSEGSWARGNGWVMMTMAEILPHLPKRSPEYKTLNGRFQELAVALAEHQTKNGLWRTIIDDKSSYEETSASAMYLFAYLRGRRVGIFGNEFDKTIESAYSGLAKYVDSNGVFSGSSEGTWPGTIEYYKSLSTGEWWWGVGAYLLALTEYDR
jgi:unsaturated rhamnogalacturonyl hydrolase